MRGVSASDDLSNRAASCTLRAKVLAARCKLDETERFARAGLDLVAETDLVEAAADAWLTLAEILRSTDETAAREASAEAIALYERKGNLVGAQRARAFSEAGRMTA